MKKITAIIAGCIFAPSTSALIAVALTALKQGASFYSLLGLFPIFYLYSLAAMLLFGLPIFLVFLYLKILSIWSSIIAGLFVGSVVAIVIRLPNSIHMSDFTTLPLIGATVGVTFWITYSVVINIKYHGHPLK